MSDADNNQSLNDNLHIRIGSDVLDTFKTKAFLATGKPHQLLIREIIHAFNEDRLRILPTEQQSKTLGELYNVTRK
jgi:hypothetical protein